MDIETCYKYAVFLNEECDRYLRGADNQKDRMGDLEDQMANLKIEFDRCMQRVMESDLPKDLKNKFSELTLDYEYDPNRDNKNLLHLLIFGRLARIRRENAHREKVEQLKYQVKGIPMYIKMHY